MKKIKLLLIITIMIFASSIFAVDKNLTAEKMLQDFVNSYNQKCKPKNEILFGFEVDAGKSGIWTIHATPDAGAVLKKGKPEKPTIMMFTDMKTLKNIHSGKMNFLTAVGRAHITDPAPLNFRFMKGAVPNPAVIYGNLPFLFHFFNRGSPEIIPFGEEHSRFIHGGNAVPIYYDEGLRTAWYQVKKGMVINKEERDQKNPFPTLIICIQGAAKAKLGDKELELKKGMSVFIPAGMTHTIWNENKEPFEFIIVMFGEGA